jgi:Flp pilus assembly protein TadD
MAVWRRVVGIALGAMCLSGTVLAQDIAEIRDLLRAERYEQALDLLVVRVRAEPDDTEARFLQGVALVELGRNDEALGVFERLTQDHPELPEPYNNLAVLYAARGDHDGARDALLRAISTHPSYATAHENLGDI